MEDVEILLDPVTEYIKEHCLPELMPTAEVRLRPSGLMVPNDFPNYLERIQNFQVRSDDIWVISFPKCGTTWTQEMVWLIGNNLDYEAAEKTLLLQRFPFLEALAIISEDQRETRDDEWVFSADTITYADQMPSPRYIKSHLPVSLLPKQIWTKKPKIIYVTRNAKDAAVSYFYHHRLWNGYSGASETFLQAFYEDKVVYSPFWEHVIEYKKLENEPNILINSFEDMLKDLPSVIRRTAAFLGKPVTETQMDRLADHLSFSRMRDNAAINGEELVKEVKERHGLDPSLHFLRRGEFGSWRHEMTPHVADMFDRWTAIKTKGTVIEGAPFLT